MEPKNSVTLKVLWYLDCPAEKSFLKSYKITYCGVDKHKECHSKLPFSFSSGYYIVNILDMKAASHFSNEL